MKKTANIDVSLSITHSGVFSKVKLKPTSRLLLMTLVNHMHREKMIMFPSFKTLARECGCREDIISSSIAELEEKNIIRKTQLTEKNITRNVYTITDDFLMEIGQEKYTNLSTMKNQVENENSTWKNREEHMEKPVNTTMKNQVKQEKEQSFNNNYEIGQKLKNGFRVSTDFQLRNAKMLEILTGSQITTYGIIPGHERQNWLNTEYNKHLSKIANDEAKKEREKEREKIKKEKNTKEWHIKRLSAGYQLFGEKFFQKDTTKKDLKAYNITIADITDCAKGYKQEVMAYEA